MDKKNDGIQYPDRKQGTPPMGGLGETHGTGAAFPNLAAPVTGQTGAGSTSNPDQETGKVISKSFLKLESYLALAKKTNFLKT